MGTHLRRLHRSIRPWEGAVEAALLVRRVQTMLVKPSNLSWGAHSRTKGAATFFLHWLKRALRIHFLLSVPPPAALSSLPTESSMRCPTQMSESDSFYSI